MPNRTPEEQRLLAKAAQYMPGGYTGNLRVREDLNFLIKEGKGSRVWDVSGNEYVDWMMGSGPMVLGHAHPAVVEAVIKAVEQGSTFFANNERAVLLAEQLVQAVPCAEKVRFTTSGTDATFQAMRSARAFRKREKVLKFEGGFHGTSDYALMSVTPSAAQEFPISERNSGGIPRAIEELMLIAPYNDIDTTSAIIDAHHDELAAVIVEPLQRMIAPQPGFLQGLRDITAKHEIPLIFDEVVTGFRLAWGGAQEFYGVTPDLCAMGKIMGGGYPLAAVMGRGDILSVYDEGSVDSDSFVNQIGTLNGNPVACAAGLATLEQLRQEGVYEKVRYTGSQVRQAIEAACAESGVPVQVCGEDAVFDAVFTDRPVHNYRDWLSADGRTMADFNAGLLERGVLKSSKFYPAVVHDEEAVAKTIQAIREVAPNLQR